MLVRELPRGLCSHSPDHSKPFDVLLPATFGCKKQLFRRGSYTKSEVARCPFCSLWSADSCRSCVFQARVCNVSRKSREKERRSLCVLIHSSLTSYLQASPTAAVIMSEKGISEGVSKELSPRRNVVAAFHPLSQGSSRSWLADGLISGVHWSILRMNSRNRI